MNIWVFLLCESLGGALILAAYANYRYWDSINRRIFEVAPLFAKAYERSRERGVNQCDRAFGSFVLAFMGVVLAGGALIGLFNAMD